MNKKAAATAFLTLAAIACFAVVSDGVSIAWKPKTGNVYKYKFKLDIPNQNLVLTADMTETIKEVKPDGSIVVEDKQSNFASRQGSQEQSVPGAVTETITEKANGEVISRHSDAPEGSDTPRLNKLSQIIFPDHPVNVGDTWKFGGKADGSPNSHDFEIEYTFRGPETVDGIASNKVDVSGKETSGDKPVSASGTVWLAADDGEVVKVQMKAKNADLPQLGQVDIEVAADRSG